MARYEYKRYKIVIDPESKKVQGLCVGDVVRRQYRDGARVIYSLMVVVESGSGYFVGALLEGDEPKSGELLDFVRVTSLTDKVRGGALYMTASDSGAPFLNVIDGMGFERSLLQLSGTHIFRDTTSLLLSGDIGHPEMLLVSYRIKGEQNGKATLSIGYANEIDGVDEIEVSTEWQYKLSAITIDYPEQYQRQLTFSSNAGICQVENINVVRLSDVAIFNNATKARVGKISGIVDPLFGKLEGYGAYFQNLYATRNVNIAGTLTAGDENGSASTFYVGKIHKNVILNSLECGFSDSLTTDTPSPVGIGLVREIPSDTTLIVQTSEWREKRLGKMYTFSIWIKCAQNSITLYQDEHRIGVVIPTSSDWQRVKLSFEVQSSQSEAMAIRLEGAEAFVTAPQLEGGEHVSQYQPTDGTLSETEGYGAWFTKGGIGGTIQNPLLRLNNDGSISSIDESFVINRDGSGQFAGGAMQWSKTSLQLSDSVVIGWGNLSEQVKENIRLEVSAGVPMWVKDWDSNKTLIGESYLITPKIFAGVKHYDGTITGVAIGRFNITTRQHSGELASETIDGIYGFRDGIKTFSVLSSGSVELGNGDNSIRYNAITAQIEFGSAVAMQWVGATYIDASGIFTGRLSAESIDAITLSATQLTAGVLNADRIAVGSIKAQKLDAKSIKSELITADYVSGLECRFVKGTIGGWGIKFGMLSADNIAIDSLNRKISVYDSLSTPSLGRRVQIYYSSDTNFGVLASDSNGDVLFRLGSNNNIAGWKITKETISKGAVSLGSDGSIYNTFRWRLSNDGSGLLANGNISWDSLGNVTFAPSVALNWTAPISEITPKLTRITADGIYTGTITAEQINAGVIDAAHIDVKALKSALITADNISSLALTSTKGTIGGWSITAYSISKNSVVLSHDGTIYNGSKWRLSNSGSGSLASGNISWSEEGVVTFSPEVEMQWLAPLSELESNVTPKLTHISSSGIYTGTLTATQINAVAISASSITVGTLNTQCIASGSISAEMLDAKSIKSEIINANYVSGLECSFVRGSIGSWDIKYGMLASENITLDALNRKIAVFDGSSTAYKGRRVQLYYTNDTDFGIRATSTWGNTTFMLGSQNIIAGWKFTPIEITKNSVTLGSDGSIYNTPNWRLGNDGSGYLARGNIKWDFMGNVTFSNSVKMQWEEKILEGELYVRSSAGSSNPLGKYITLNGKVILHNMHNGFTVTVIDRRSLVHKGNYNFDTSYSDYQVRRMVYQLYSISANDIVIVTSYGSYILPEWLNTALQRCGSHSYSPSLTSPYILIGIGGIGRGNGLVSTTKNSTYNPIAELTTTIKNGVPQGVNGGGGITTHITGDGIYTGSLNANQITAGVIDARYIDVETLKSGLITADAIESLTLTTTKGTIGGWNISSSSISKGSVVLSSDGSITNGSRWRLNTNGSGYLANGNISWDTAGGITAKNAEFINVRIQGSVRNKFVLNDSSIWIGGAPDDQENFNNFDNIVTIRGGWNEHIELPWGLDQSGRRVTLVNSRWRDQKTQGYMDITSPEGKWFYEDGVRKRTIKFSNEYIELLGYGDDRDLYGWIVVNRRDIETEGKYGSFIQVLAQGYVTSSGSLSYRTFDGATISASKWGSGRYRVNLPAEWNLNGKYLVMLTGRQNGAPRYASVGSQQASYFDVYTQDDASANDGGFNFQISSTNNWDH